MAADPDHFHPEHVPDHGAVASDFPVTARTIRCSHTGHIVVTSELRGHSQESE